MMLDKLENSSGWYAEATTRKVKYLLCEASFAKKATRMLSHLGYEGPCGVRDKGVSLCRRATSEIRRLVHKSCGTFPLYL
jgi:formamidopyrimidine-DNA glycosylase